MTLWKRCLTGAAASAALVPFVPLGAVAHAAPPPANTATVISHVTIDRSDPSVGYVQARYTCQPEVDHLWVSVKQNATGTADPELTQEGSGFEHGATTWLQSHPVNMQCDGRNHVQTFKVDTTEVPPWGEGQSVGYGQLVRGQAYVQFCLVSTTDESLFVADRGFHDVL